MLAATGPAGAADVDWLAAGVGTEGTSPADPSTQWGVNSNWNPAGVPGPSDSAYFAFTRRGTVYGGTAAVGDLYIASTGAGTAAAFYVTWTLPGTFTVNHCLTIGQSGANRIEHHDGTLEAGYLGLGGSATYVFPQGLLHLSAGANLRGTLKMYGDDTSRIQADDSTLVDLAHTTFVNTSAGTYTAGAHSLTILAPGADPNTLFGYFNTAGRLHTLGNTLSVAASESLGGCGDLEDFVEAQGTLAARSWGFISLLGGVHVLPGGQVNLAGGTLLTDGTASAIDGGMLTAQHQFVGSDADGSMTQDGGHSTAEAKLLLGRSAGVTGTYTLGGGSLLALGWDIVGYSGRGSFVQAGGTHTAASGIDLGFAPDGVGSYELAGGLLQVGRDLYVGSLGTGQVTLTGGTVTIAEGLHLGAVGGAIGSYSLESGHLDVAGTEGVGDLGQGFFIQTGGSHVVGGDLMLGGLAETASGDFRLYGGELNVLGNEWIGFNGIGWMEQTAGQHTVAGYCVLGASSVGTTAQPGAGVLLLTGGSMAAPYVGVYGDSHFLLGGGTLEIDGGLYFNKASAGTRAMTGAAALLLRDSSIAYLGQAQGGGQTTLQAGTETLVVLPPGADPNTFFSSTNSAGLICVGGTVVPIPQGITVRGIGELDDPVYCAGTMAARAGQFINLNAGARVGPGGSLDLGDGDLTVDDAWSGMEGSRLQAHSLYVGKTGTGTFTQTDGVTNLGGSLVLGGTAGARGVFHIAAGSLTMGGDILLAMAPSSTGQMRVGRDAYVQAENLTIYPYPGYLPPESRQTKLTVELPVETGSGGAGDTRGKIKLTGQATLGGFLDVQAMNEYRPREGQSFTIITMPEEPHPPHYSGSFIGITSNIASGLPGSSAFSGAVSGFDYRITFLGYSAGDVNGDHTVDGGDLALMGGNWMRGGTRPLCGDCNLDDTVDGGDLALMGGSWMKTGMTWAQGDFSGDGQVDGSDIALMGGNWMRRLMAWGDGDFNGDDTVEGGDLALMGGNWMWALPPPPQNAPLPEPATTALIGAGWAVLLLPRRRARS
ncbi:MAG: hypothetical protein MUP47_01660 [Phycisphaerae bacterium]|nr:hypothetical protein [Phycisphaerae bacterium]